MLTRRVHYRDDQHGRTRWPHDADRTVQRVSHIDVSPVVYRDPDWPVKRCCDRRPPVAREVAGAVSGKRSDGPVRELARATLIASHQFPDTAIHTAPGLVDTSPTCRTTGT